MEQQAERKVGFLLGVGIVFLPIIFSWFTLRKGHSVLSRVVSFLWLCLPIIYMATSDGSATEKRLIEAEERLNQIAVTQDSNSSEGGAAQQAPANTAQEPADAVYKTTATQLFKDYEENEVAADEKMKGKSIEVSGVIKSIDKDAFDKIVIWLKTGDEFSAAGLTLKDSEKQAAMNLKKGSKIVIVCQKMTRIIGSPMGRNCIIK